MFARTFYPNNAMHFLDRIDSLNAFLYRDTYVVDRAWILYSINENLNSNTALTSLSTENNFLLARIKHLIFHCSQWQIESITYYVNVTIHAIGRIFKLGKATLNSFTSRATNIPSVFICVQQNYKSQDDRMAA